MKTFVLIRKCECKQEDIFDKDEAELVEIQAAAEKVCSDCGKRIFNRIQEVK